MEQHRITLSQQQFEGPLDLLLSLIEDQKLNITEIALAQVTEQFLQYVRQLEELDPTSLSDFLAIAAKLLVIKSKAILPSLEIEQDEDDAGVPLETQLLLYKQFREVARHLKVLDAAGKQSFTRSLVFSQRISFFPDPNVTTQELHGAILKVLSELKELDNLPKARIKEAISIQEKITHLQGLLSRQIETKLSSVLAQAKNKSEVIVTFLALLELIKQRIFSVEQEALFTDITIRKVEQQTGQGL
jgi:segregation and condensation protein A